MDYTFTPAGDLWTRLQRNYSRLEETRYYPENVYQREKAATRWPGDLEGRTLLSWVLLARACGRPPRYLTEMLAMWESEVNRLQYFGNIYTDGISEQQLSSHGWVLQALAELQRAQEAEHSWATGHDPKAMALPIIKNLFLPTRDAYAEYSIDPSEREAAGEYSGSHLKQIGPWILSTDVGCFTIGMAGLIDACEAFDLKDLCGGLIETMIERFLSLDLVAIQAQTHATLTALRGMIRWSQMTGDESLWGEIEKRYQLYTGTAWTETYANYNWFERPRWTEPCAMVDSLMVVMALWRKTGKRTYLEQAQLIWFNALGHGQRTNGGFGCDNCPGADGETDLHFSTPESHWCCTMRGSEGLARMCQYQVVRARGVLQLLFGLPGEYRDGGQHIRIDSPYPSHASWRIHNLGTESVTLEMFIPSWVGGIETDEGWLTLHLAPGEDATIQGQLEKTERTLQPATKRLNPDFGEGTIRMKGPLVLARYGEEWHPIWQDYLRADMSMERSIKQLIVRKT